MNSSTSDGLRRRRNAPDDSNRQNGSTGGGQAAANGKELKLDLNSAKDIAATLHVQDGRVKVLAPGTPWNEIDLGDTFLAHAPTIPKKGILSTRRLFFVVGGLLGIFFGWLFTEGPGSALTLNDLGELDFDSTFTALRASWAESSMLSSLGGLNISDVFNGAGKQWLKNNDFKVGRKLQAEGATKEHAVMLVPGIVSTGLESWSTTEEHSQFFRKRIWGTAHMIRAVLMRKEAWIRAMSLDPDTGLDPPGSKVRAAQGLDAAAYFLQGYWIWQKVIENLAVLDYDHNDMNLAAYDWRLSYINLETRDSYFSRMKAHIEVTKRILGKKTILTSHSMGGSVVLFFLKWVEAEGYGNGGPTWVRDHLEGWITIAGTTLGVPKAMAALLSGEMRDTVELNPAGVYLLEKFFSRRERTALFRSWAGSASMWPKGGNEIWGNADGAPDDPENATLTYGNAYYFRQVDAPDKVNAQTTRNLTTDAAFDFLLQHSSSSFQKMLEGNYSHGFERDPKQIKKNDQDHRKWSNPLEVQLPNAPDFKIYCLYGIGKPTERSFWYRSGSYEQDDVDTAGSDAQCEGAACNTTTHRTPLDFPLTQQVWVDGEVTIENSNPKVRSGVNVGDGDGTVSVLSLGAMCTHGWKSKLYNPAGIRVVTREYEHRPESLDIRGGSTTADHIDILGSLELNEDVLNVASGRERLLEDRILSGVDKFADKINWPK